MSTNASSPILGDPNRDNLLTPIRLGLAIAVALPHAFMAVRTPVLAPSVEAGFGGLGDWAVNGFFLLSGFLIAKSLVDRADLLGFAVSRVLRLMPALLALAFSMTFVFGPILTSLPLARYFSDPETWTFPWVFGFFVDAAASLPGVFETSRSGDVSRPTWTLRHEALAYFGAAIAWAFGLWRGRIGALVVLALAILAYLVARLPQVEPLLPATLFHLTRFGVCFAFGGAAYFFRDRIPLAFWPIGFGALVFALAVALWPQNALVGNLVGGYALLVLAYRFQALAARLRGLPDLSYGVYIWHVPVYHTLLTVEPGLHPIALIVIGLPIALVVAWASWSFVEKPALDAKSRATAALRRLFIGRSTPARVQAPI